MRGQHRHGMGGRAAERCAVHPRYDPQHGIHRHPAAHAAEEAGAWISRRICQDKWVYVEGADASSNGRSIPMEKALDDVLVAFKANGEALRMEHGYPGPPGRARLGRQHVGQVAAPDRSDRHGCRKPRGDLEIHRCVRGRHRAQMDMGHGCEIGHHLAQPADADQAWARGPW